jgi:hypothetical protein
MEPARLGETIQPETAKLQSTETAKKKKAKSESPTKTVKKKKAKSESPTKTAKKNKTKSTSSAKEPAKKGYAASTPQPEGGEAVVEKEEGPWKAVRQHFAGYPEYQAKPAESEPGRSALPQTDSTTTRPDSSAAEQTDSTKPGSGSSAAETDCSAVTGEAAFRPRCIPQSVRVKALIAVVPDPVQTHMALRFDRTVDAIELAAESMEYEIDRYWLPWESETKAGRTDYESGKEDNSDREHKETQPGLLLFRREEQDEGKAEAAMLPAAKARAKEKTTSVRQAKATILYVFLVGEEPTGGINGEQFYRAVRYADLVNESAPRSAEAGPPGKDDFCSSETGSHHCTYVVGPTYSASFATLAGLIQRRPEWQNKFAVNATARNSAAMQPVERDLRLASFAKPVPEATQQLTEVLANNGYINKPPCAEDEKHQVAVLSETSTPLGESFEVAAPEPKVVVDSNNCIDIFKYPREIASLRNAYGALNPQSPKAGEPSRGPRPSLSVNLTETSKSSDEPPDFSKTQSPFSQEAALMAIAAEMQRKHYRYIGINGSNPLDIVFLLSFVRSAVPNARLFSFDADLLLQHEPDNEPYIGTLSVTTYPLLYRPLNEIGERRAGKNETGESSAPGKRTRLPFTSQREEAIYNATICLVRTMPGEGDAGDLSEREACPPAIDPPLWLTAYGIGGHWPIQVLGPDADKAPPQLENLELPSGWKATCSLLDALALVHVLLLLGLVQLSPKFQAFKLETFAPARQLLGIHIASATLALAVALVALSAWKPNIWTGISMVFFGALPGVAGLLTIKYFRWWWKEKAKPLPELYLFAPRSPGGIAWQMAAFAGIWTAAGVLAYMWWTLRDAEGGHYGAFFSFRAVNLASIVSPLTPMLPLLAAIYLGAIFYVWHLAFDERIRPRLNPSDEPTPPLKKLRPGLRSEKLIANAVNGDWKNGWIGVVFLLLWVIVFLRPQFELFERQAFRTVYEILFVAVMLLILISAVRLFRIWQELRRFLLEVNRQRVRGVLRQLESEGSSWFSIWYYGSEDPDLDYRVRSLGVLQELWHTPGKPDGSEDIDKVMTDIRTLRRNMQQEKVSAFSVLKVTADDGTIERATRRAQDRFAGTLNDALDRLSGIWALPVEAQKGIKWLELLEKYVALRWMAFIRAVIGRIRLLMIFLAVSFSLAMISLVIYSFEPHRELLWSVTALFITIGVIMVKVLIEMHRDPVLSYMTNTKPGKLDFAFLLHLTLGVAPLLTLLVTYFPGVGRYVISFLQPGLEALKH